MDTVLDKPKVEKAAEGRCSCPGTCFHEMREAGKRVEKTMNDAKATVSEKLEDRKIATGRLFKRGRHAVEDGIEEAAHNIKRHPFSSFALAFAAGAALGFLVPRVRGPKSS